MNRHTILLAALLALLITAPASATQFTGKVVGITDGDTLTVLDQTNTSHRVRLAEIDAPEKNQPFGQASKQSLSEICFGKQAVLEDEGRDRYGRVIAIAVCDGIDANAEQVKRGMAWVYIKYAKRRVFFGYEHDAKTAGTGLWQESNPMPPWEWRHR